MNSPRGGMHDSVQAGLHASAQPAARQAPQESSPSQETLEKANLSKLLIESHYQVLLEKDTACALDHAHGSPSNRCAYLSCLAPENVSDPSLTFPNFHNRIWPRTSETACRGAAR
jgi:hypothetical protein